MTPGVIADTLNVTADVQSDGSDTFSYNAVTLSQASINQSHKAVTPAYAFIIFIYSRRTV